MTKPTRKTVEYTSPIEGRRTEEFHWTPIRIALALAYSVALVTLYCVIPGGAG